MLRQLLAATLSAVLVAPAYPSESTLPRSSSTPSHTYDAATLSKTRVWGSNEKILLHFRAVLLVSGKQHWGSAKCSCKNVVGSVVTYDYDAFGNLTHSTGTTPNNYLFASEQFDPDLGMYFLRARYLNTSTGRFWSMDTEEGDDQAPLSLHKYLYGEGDPINNIDPSGNEIDEIAAGAMSMTLDAMPSSNFMQVVKEVSDSLQLCCRSNVIDAMKTIWGESGNGTSGGEASFTVNGTLGNYTIQVQPYTNERKKQQLKINTKDNPNGITFALFHVHPNNSGPKPSTPGNNAEGNPLGDTAVADKYQFDIYVVSGSGLWMYSWERKKDVQLRENLDWTKPCSEKPLLATKWVNP